MQTTDLNQLPANLPVPRDDGAAAHLPGWEVPPISLMSTDGEELCLSPISDYKRTVVYCYPMTGRPDTELPAGWSEIPGARGCTPQSCSFRDHQAQIEAENAAIFGLSTQTTEWQTEAARRLNLQFPLLSDSQLVFASALRLPLFEVEGAVLIKRITLIIWKRRVVKVFYPVFPPDKNAGDVLEWLKSNP